MVIRYEIEFKGRALSVTQEISPDGSPSGNNKPNGDVKDRPGIEGVANTQQIHGLDVSTKHGEPDKPQSSTTIQRSSAQIPAVTRMSSDQVGEGGSGNTESPGSGGGGPLSGLVIIFGPVIVPPPGGPGGGGGGNPENPGPG